MPTYEYQCRNCGHQLEAFQKMSDAPLTECPACQGNHTLQKLVSPVGFQLKGTGWYVTDFRNKGKPAPEKTDANTAETVSSASKTGSGTGTAAATESTKSAALPKTGTTDKKTGTTDKTGD